MFKDHEFFKPYSFDRGLFFTTLALLTIGVIFVFSSSGVRSIDNFGHSSYYFFQQLAGAGFGLLLIFIMLRISFAFYQNPFFIVSFLLLTLTLLILCLIMPSIGPTKRWLHVLNFRVQPSEIAKFSLIFFIAYFISRKKEKINHPINLSIPITITFFIVLLVLLEPDYSTAFLICTISVLMLYLGGLKFNYFLIPGSIALGTFLFFLLTSPYRLQRIIAFASPEKDPLGSGFQIIQSQLAMGSGGLFRLNIGESIQKLFFLPYAHTDYIYAIVGEELGFIGAMTVLILFLIFLWRGLVISRKAPNLFSQLVAAGITLAIFVQAMVNICVVLGLAPPTGLPLPLISYGRSSLIMTLFCIGILLHISQRRTNKWKKQ